MRAMSLWMVLKLILVPLVHELPFMVSVVDGVSVESSLMNVQF